MEIFKHLMLSFLSIATLIVMVHADHDSHSGFISIDCGLPENSGYTDKKTGINYTSDATFTETGVSYNISSEYNSNTLEQQFLNVRSFPEGTRNCYTIKPALENIKFLIRARFMYGNYDGKSKVPSFDLLLGADVWDSVELENATTIVTKEIIHIPRSNYVYVCLINKGSGTPFMSSLEFRVLKNTTHQTQSGSLLLYLRWDLGSTTDKTIRYGDDIYDRIWEPYNRPDWAPISTSSVIYTDVEYQQPSAVMRTAVTPSNGNDSLTFSWATGDNTAQYYIYLHFAELQSDQMTKQTRQMYIYLNRTLWYTQPYVLKYLKTSSLRSASPTHNVEISINKTEESPLPPILNALEIYKVKDFQQLLTNQQDVDAIMNIKIKYGVTRSNWQGDPCTPKDYLWRGLNCSYNEYNPPRIIFLNLSSSGLVGEIPPFISSLTMIESLDLSNNSFTGPVPSFLPQLPYLKVLNLAGNKLKGSVPAELIERRDNDFLTLSVDGNPDLCLSASCTKEKNVVVPVLASIVAVSVLVAASSILWILKTRKEGTTWNNENDGTLQLKNRRFLYSDVLRITDNFERIIGRGGFGTVYHGNLDRVGSVRIRNALEDRVAWSLCSRGIFSVQSFLRSVEEASRNGWLEADPIWKGYSPPKVELFMWQLLRGRIMVRDFICRFGVLSNANTECPLCMLHGETIDHLFLHCDWAWKLWTKCVDWWGVLLCPNNNFQQWFRSWKGLCPCPSFKRVWMTLFNAIAWTIWEARNKAVFKGISADLQYYSDLVRFRVAWWFKHHGKGSSEPITLILENLTSCCKEVKSVKPRKKEAWIPPSGEALKFNVDGSVRGDAGRSGIGGVLRNSLGEVLCSFSAFVGNLDVNSTELLAIHKACMLCVSNSSLKGRKILIVSDSSTVVSWVNDEDFGNLAHVNVIFDIRSLLRLLDNTSVSHNSRDTNLEADKLAKRGSSMEGEFIEWRE